MIMADVYLFSHSTFAINIFVWVRRTEMTLRTESLVGSGWSLFGLSRKGNEFLKFIERSCMVILRIVVSDSGAGLVLSSLWKRAASSAKLPYD